MTSGGTPGPRLTDDLAMLDNNVYGTLPGAPPADSIAESLAAEGWRVRASSWNDFEAEREWVRVELHQRPGEIILDGVVDSSRMEDFAAALAALGLRYSIELWNTGGTELIRELRN